MTEAALNRVVGTAGHVDHGKSALVRALTGTDPDRLEEERRRGMTIELGFASWRLPSGRRVGVVDVPGHRRLVRTMVAGAQGFDLVLLVVAANEGVMPQTREHLAICELLGLRDGVVALTKIDLVDEVTAEVARSEIADLLAGTALAAAPVVPCSAVTGEGLPELGAAVDRALDAVAPRPATGIPRLYVDRAFSMPGFGPVVTGTLENGALAVGQEVAVLPAGGRARIRGLQRHGETVEEVPPGARTAVNLSGIERRSLGRGMALVPSGTVGSTARIDALLHVSASAPIPLRQRSIVELHVGTAEVAAAVTLLEVAELRPGEEGLAQLQLDRPLPILPGDRLVLRRGSLPATVGGGLVLDIAPRRHRRADPATISALRHRLEGRGALVVEELRKRRLGTSVPLLVARTGLAAGLVREELARLGAEAVAVGALWFARERWDSLVAASLSALQSFHEAEPLREGMPRDRWAGELRLGAAGPAVARALIDAGLAVERSGLLALPDHRPQLGERSGPVEAAVAFLEERGLEAPAPDELARRGIGPDVLHLLAREGRVVRLPGGIVLAAAAHARARAVIEAHLREHGQATVAELRDRLGATRRVVVPLLEQLDSARVTVRSGDIRRLRSTAGAA